LRIPKAVADSASIKEGSVVDLTLVEGKLVAVPLGREAVTGHPNAATTEHLKSGHLG
jgi:antitoxin component of MazEF toxin-antitoxin module